MLNKKQIQAIFLLNYKMGHKEDTTHYINNAFDPGSPNEMYRAVVVPFLWLQRIRTVYYCYYNYYWEEET